MSNTAQNQQEDNVAQDLYSQGINGLKLKVTRNEEILRSNRVAVKSLSQAHGLGHASASYWLGIVKLNDLDGTGQDLSKAADYFAAAYQRGQKGALKGAVLVHGLIGQRITNCLKDGFSCQARGIIQEHNELSSWILKAQSEQVPLRRTKSNKDETMEFPLPTQLIMT